MTRLTTTALVCLLALSAGGCAIELPKSAFSGFRLAPADDVGKGDANSQRHQDVKHISVP